MGWQEVADAVVSRRVELGMQTRKQLASVSNLTVKTLGEIERADRMSYDPATLARVEQVLQWPRGAIQAMVDGGDPPAPGSRVAYAEAAEARGQAFDATVAIEPDPSLFLLSRTLDQVNRLLGPDSPLAPDVREDLSAAIWNTCRLAERPTRAGRVLADDEAREMFGRTMASLERHQDEVGFGAAERS